MRLIDADALIAEEQERTKRATDNPDDSAMAKWIFEIIATLFIDSVKNAPTIEAASVVHSHWIVRDLDAEYKRRAICPRCGWIAVETHDGFIKLSDFNFCAHCGAKMDEKENEK